MVARSEPNTLLIDSKAEALQASHAFGRQALLRCLRSYRRGDFSVRMPPDLAGIDGEIAQAFNEIVQARAALDKKVEQLSLASHNKSEFLANMSHGLRTPLNSLLLLARLLSDNAGGNLTRKQVEFARVIHASGAEMLALVNDILDLAKIESGTITLDFVQKQFSDLRDYAERNFRQMAIDKCVDFSVLLAPGLPAVIETDGKRLQQIIGNLLANAFKFTSKGSVRLCVQPVRGGWNPDHPVLDRAAQVIAFSVADTGVGIPVSKQRVIFEPFQQVNTATSPEYGGTGLGLSISRELANLLGGQIRVKSAPGEGSTFTLYLPVGYRAAEIRAVAPPTT